MLLSHAESLLLFPASRQAGRRQRAQSNSIRESLWHLCYSSVSLNRELKAVISLKLIHILDEKKNQVQVLTYLH